ncbi:MAG: PIN domain-containing protein [Bacteroidales bacterium]|nr:PIN domain-containing protein [Bacteroidales bacterium]
MKIFCDTNIILDILIKERPNSDVSLKVWEIVKSNLVEAVVSTQSIIDSYYSALKARILKQEIDLTAYWIMNHLNVRPIGFFEFQEALESGEKDVEDASQIALAKAERCDVFITSDAKILSKEESDSLRFMSPSDFVARMSEA